MCMHVCVCEFILQLIVLVQWCTCFWPHGPYEWCRAGPWTGSGQVMPMCEDQALWPQAPATLLEPNPGQAGIVHGPGPYFIWAVWRPTQSKNSSAWSLGALHCPCPARIALWGPLLPPHARVGPYTAMYTWCGAHGNGPWVSLQDPWRASQTRRHSSRGQIYLADWGLSTPLLV